MEWEAINTRAAAQWEIIAAHLDLRHKTVVDLGCGGADLLHFALRAGAASADGVEREFANEARLRLYTAGHRNFAVYDEDVLVYCMAEPDHSYDVGFCLAVLPYIPDIHQTYFLQNLRRIARQVVLEVQYAGDGPGLAHIPDDAAMRTWLAEIWSHVTRLGATPVADRYYPDGSPVQRTLWLCQ